MTKQRRYDFSVITKNESWMEDEHVKEWLHDVKKAILDASDALGDQNTKILLGA